MPGRPRGFRESGHTEPRISPMRWRFSKSAGKAWQFLSKTGGRPVPTTSPDRFATFPIFATSPDRSGRNAFSKSPRPDDTTFSSKARPGLEKPFSAGRSPEYSRPPRIPKSSRSRRSVPSRENRAKIRFRTSARSLRYIRERAWRACFDEDRTHAPAKSPSPISARSFWTNSANFRPTCSTPCANPSKTAKCGFRGRSEATRTPRGSSCSRRRTLVRADTRETAKNPASARRQPSRGTGTAYRDPCSTASTSSPESPA